MLASIVRAVKSFLSWLLHEGFIKDNPLTGVPVPNLCPKPFYPAERKLANRNDNLAGIGARSNLCLHAVNGHGQGLTIGSLNDCALGNSQRGQIRGSGHCPDTVFVEGDDESVVHRFVGSLRDHAELNDVRIRLSKLYDALETGKLSLNELAPRIKELRTREDELSKARLQLEAEKITRGIKHVDAEVIKSYARDLKSLLEEADIAESKAFLRSFIKRIEIDKSLAVVHYNLPMPPDGGMRESLGVLPMVTPGGAEGTRTPDLLRAKEALSQLSYSPACHWYYSNKNTPSQFAVYR